MKAISTFFIACFATISVQGQDLLFDAGFNNNAPYLDDLPALIGIGQGNNYYADYGRMKRVNDSVFVYYINTSNYDNNTYDCQARAIIAHSDGSATHELVLSATGSFNGGSPEDWSITDVVANPTNGHIYVAQNALYDDAGTTRHCVHVHGMQFDAVNGNFGYIPLWGQNQSGMTEISLSGADIHGAKGTLLAGSPYWALNIEGNQTRNVALSAVISNGQGFSFTSVTANASSLYSTVADIIAVSTTEVYIADNAYTFTYVNPNAQYNDYARILKFNPSAGGLDQTYGGGNGIALLSWNTQSNTNFVQDQIKRILYDGGKLFVAGYSREDIGAQYTPVHGKVTRLTSTGTADNTFASTGTFAPDFSSDRFRTYFNDIDKASDGSVYLSGSGSVTDAPNSPTTSFILAVNDNGSIQTNKGTNGFLFESTDYFEIGESIIIPGSSTLTDKFVFTGYYASNPAETAVGRLVWSNSVQPAGLNELEHSNLSIYPNPAENQLTITAQQATAIEIITLTGTTLFHGELHPGQNRVDISDLDAGVYLIRSANESTIRFIKQ